MRSKAKDRIAKLFEATAEPLYAGDIAFITKCGAGRLYPALYDLERAGVITSGWDNPAPTPWALPRRRLYRRAP